jgi:hypothetical protein
MHLKGCSSYASCEACLQKDRGRTGTRKVSLTLKTAWSLEQFNPASISSCSPGDLISDCVLGNELKMYIAHMLFNLSMICICVHGHHNFAQACSSAESVPSLCDVIVFACLCRFGRLCYFLCKYTDCEEKVFFCTEDTHSNTFQGSVGFMISQHAHVWPYSTSQLASTPVYHATFACSLPRSFCKHASQEA